MMENPVIPAWIKSRKDAADASKAIQELDRQKQNAASLLIQKDGPKFWDRFVTSSKMNVDALPTLGVRGSLSVMGNVKVEASAIFHLNSESLMPRLNTLNVFYSERNPYVVRCHPLSGDGFNIPLCVVDNVVYATPDPGVMMSAEELAEELVRRLVDSISGREHEF
jgi:hypothetical protein